MNKKELPLVAFFLQELLLFYFKMLSATIGVRASVIETTICLKN